jgi:hypothetical protein
MVIPTAIVSAANLNERNMLISWQERLIRGFRTKTMRLASETCQEISKSF